MATKPKGSIKRKVIGIIFTLLGTAGLVYAAASQFAPGMDKKAAAGILLFSVIIVFIGIAQLYKKDANDY